MTLGGIVHASFSAARVYSYSKAVARALQIGSATTNQFALMKTKSTYSLLVSSQEKGRNIFEALVYAAVVLSSVASLLQFAGQSVAAPQIGIAHAKTQSALVATAPLALLAPRR